MSRKNALECKNRQIKKGPRFEDPISPGIHSAALEFRNERNSARHHEFGGSSS